MRQFFMSTTYLTAPPVAALTAFRFSAGRIVTGNDPWGGATVRALIPFGEHIPSGNIDGHEFRVRVQAHPSVSFTVNRFFAATKTGGNLVTNLNTNLNQSSGFQAVLFNGAQGVTIPAGQSQWSDWFTLPDAGKQGHDALLLSCHVTGTSQGQGFAIPVGGAVGFLLGDAANDTTNQAWTAWNYIPAITAEIEFRDIRGQVSTSLFQWRPEGTSLGWGGYTFRTRFNSDIVAGSSGNTFRVRITCGSSSMSLNGIFASTNRNATNQNDMRAFDFASAAIPITFGGSSVVTLAANETRWSDPFTLPNFGNAGNQAVVLSAYIDSGDIARFNNVLLSTTISNGCYILGNFADSMGTPSWVLWNDLGLFTGLAAVVGDVQTLFDGRTTGENLSWTTATVRHRFPSPPLFKRPDGWRYVRFRMQAASGGSFFLSRMFVTTKDAASTADQAGFNGTGFVQVFFGGQPNVTIPASGEVRSDWVLVPNYGDPGHETLLTSFFFDGTVWPVTVSRAGNDGPSGIESGWLGIDIADGTGSYSWNISNTLVRPAIIGVEVSEDGNG